MRDSDRAVWDDDPGAEEFAEDASILRSIVKEANQNFGVYASVVTQGEVCVGDLVEVD